MYRPDGVTMIAIWYFCSAVFSLLGLAGMSLGFLGLWTSADSRGIVFGTLGMIIGVFAILLFGIAHGLVGWGLWTLKSWSVIRSPARRTPRSEAAAAQPLAIKTLFLEIEKSGKLLEWVTFPEQGVALLRASGGLSGRTADEFFGEAERVGSSIASG